MRRRLRTVRRQRDTMLLELGALVYELHRQGRRAPDLLQQKAARLTVVDDQVRALDDALAGVPAAAPEPFEEEAATDEWDAGATDGLEDDEEDEADGEQEPAEDTGDEAEPALAEGEEPRG